MSVSINNDFVRYFDFVQVKTEQIKSFIGIVVFFTYNLLEFPQLIKIKSGVRKD